MRRWLARPDGQLAYLSVGTGRPVTLFAHGLGGCAADTRPFATGLPGTRVLAELRGHAVSTLTGPLGYQAVAADLRALADHVGADRALGVSLGAGALGRILAEQPDRFERVALVLPAAFDRPSPGERLPALAAAAAGGDTGALATALLTAQPGELRGHPALTAWATGRATVLAGPEFAAAVHALRTQAPVPDPAALADCRARVLVIAQDGDEAHPVAAAEALTAAVPGATLKVFGPGGLLVRHRAAVRELLVDFLV